jgi:CheY-like chemotaxis protein
MASRTLNTILASAAKARTASINPQFAAPGRRARAGGGRSGRGAALPAVALTALALPEDRMQSLAAGFQTHVSKPVELAELIMVIATLTRNQRQGATGN